MKVSYPGQIRLFVVCSQELSAECKVETMEEITIIIRPAPPVNSQHVKSFC